MTTTEEKRSLRSETDENGNGEKEKPLPEEKRGLRSETEENTNGEKEKPLPEEKRSLRSETDENANGEKEKPLPEEKRGLRSETEENTNGEKEKPLAEEHTQEEEPKKEPIQEKEKAGEEEKEEIGVDTEAKSGVSFPVKLEDGKRLRCVGLRKKSMLGMGIKIYAFGIYTDNEKAQKDLLKPKNGKPTKEMYQTVIDGDFGLTVRLVIVYSGLTMSIVKKNFDEGLGASIKKLTGGKKDDQLANKVLGQASDSIKLTPGSVIEITRLPGYLLQTKVKGEVVSSVESELLCRAYVNMYLGDDAFDKEAKEKFGISMLSVF